MSNPRQGEARPKFLLGQLYADPSTLEFLKRSGQDAHTLLARHVQGDWGFVHAEHAAANERALALRHQIVSCYPVGSRIVWIITEADRSATVLLHGEY